MRKRSRISITVDADNLILIIRLHNLRDDQDEPADLIDMLKTVESPWLYRAIFDFRRYQADLSRDYLAFLTQKWMALSDGRDQDQAMALIANTPKLRMNLKAMTDVMPDRRIAVFETFDEGLDWLKSDSYGCAVAAYAHINQTLRA
ncbi:MAG: hypothetical protein WBQ60_12985 [Asticcacaulis sp.]